MAASGAPAVEGAQHELRAQAGLRHLRAQVLADERGVRPARPAAGRVSPGVARLVLRRQRVDGDPLLSVRLHPFHQVLSEGGHRGGVILERATVERRLDAPRRVRALLHPSGRRPGAGPEAHIALDGHCGLHERDELLLIASNREACQRRVRPARDFVVGVAVHRVVGGADWDTPERKVHAIGTEQQVQREVPVGLAQHRQEIPAHLVERAAEPFPGLCSRSSRRW